MAEQHSTGDLSQRTTDRIIATLEQGTVIRILFVVVLLYTSLAVVPA